jgi:hypothetical protein
MDELTEPKECYQRWGEPPEDDRVLRVCDLFCGPGGVGKALQRVFRLPTVRGWFTGVDIRDYETAYPGEFTQADVQELDLADFNRKEPFDLVWASPPCQAYSRLSHIHYEQPKDVHPTIPELEVRKICSRLGKEYIIENVVGCDDLNDPTRIEAQAFGVPMIFPRLFETSFRLPDYTKPRGQAVSDEWSPVRMATASREELAAVKHVPETWSEQELRAAIPQQMVAYILAHCPTLPDIEPPGGPSAYRACRVEKEQPTLWEFSGVMERTHR